MIAVALLSLVLAGGPAFAAEPGREAVEAKISAVFARMKALSDASPFTELEARDRLAAIVGAPSICKASPDDKYCRLYEAVHVSKPGLDQHDVFIAFTADEIIALKLPRRMVGCSGDSRVFAKFAEEGGLSFQRVYSHVAADYSAACWWGGRRLEHRKSGSHLNGHAAVAVRWGGQWHVLDASTFDSLNYARSGPPGREIVSGDSPQGLVGRELYFGFPSDPYILTEAGDTFRDVFTYQGLMAGDGSCRGAPEPPPCRFQGAATKEDGVLLDFSCGACYIHESNRVPVSIATGTVCEVSRHHSNGRPDAKDCLCVSCPGRAYSFYGEKCRPF